MRIIASGMGKDMHYGAASLYTDHCFALLKEGGMKGSIIHSFFMGGAPADRAAGRAMEEMGHSSMERDTEG